MQPISTLLATVLLAAAVPASGEVADCAAIEDAAERLACYDAGQPQAEAAHGEPEPTVAGEPEQAEDSEAAAPRAYPRTDPKEIREADEKGVEDCEFLGSVVGKSGWGGLAATVGARGSKRSAKKRAAKLGATHIVFGHFANATTISVSTTQARAYRCPPRR